MEKLRWYFRRGECYEDFNVLWGDEKWILVENCNTGAISFGLREDFGTLFGFPVSSSCLAREEAKNLLYELIKIDEYYDDGNSRIHIWEHMLAALDA